MSYCFHRLIMVSFAEDLLHISEFRCPLFVHYFPILNESIFDATPYMKAFITILEITLNDGSLNFSTIIACLFKAFLFNSSFNLL